MKSYYKYKSKIKLKLSSPSNYNTKTAKQTLDVLCIQLIKCKENVTNTFDNVSQSVIENVNNRNSLAVTPPLPVPSPDEKGGGVTRTVT